MTSASTTLTEGQLTWQPRPDWARHTNMAQFMDWVNRTTGTAFSSYEELNAWSVADIEAFWGAIWQYFEVISETPYERVLDSHVMPGARWFPGSKVNFAEHVLRHEARFPDRVVLHHSSELRAAATITWAELGGQVRSLASHLRALGVGKGDCVVSYMPNVPETLVAMLAVTAIGAVWSSAAPEFGPQTVLDRFFQIEPKVVFAADGYRFNGKDFSRTAEIEAIVGKLDSVETVIWLRYLEADASLPQLPSVRYWSELVNDPVPATGFHYERVSSDHPLWVLFSSGTTGLPKAIVHGHAGVLVEFYKTASLHMNLTPDSRMFFYTTTGWMMWNTLVWAPLVGGQVVLYDGSPTAPNPDVLWQMAANAGVTCFGTSPTYVDTMRRQGIAPAERYDLSRVRHVFLAGSPATPETFSWLYDNLGTHLWIASSSGGTEFASGVVGSSPLLPVHAGEIQYRCLGVDVRVLDESGSELTDQVGEMVVAQPMPSMPIFLWGDRDFVRYRQAYFDVYPGLWRHGDFMKVNNRGGCYVYGRSDATLNRYGVRIGSAEIYRTVEGIPGIRDSVVICIETPGGGYYMPLFVELEPAVTLDEALASTIRARLRTERSPRHVPEEILAVPEVPYTLTGKRLEVPIRKLLMGWPVQKAYSRDTLRNPAAMDWFVQFAQTRLNDQASSMYTSKMTGEARP